MLSFADDVSKFIDIVSKMLELQKGCNILSGKLVCGIK